MSSQATFKELFTAVDSLATEIGKELKKSNKKIGDTSTLKTTNKGDIVSAVNEIKDALANTGQAFSLQDAKDGLIKNGARASDTTYSSEKIESYVTEQITAAKASVKEDILDGAEAAYDTLKEIQEIIKKDKTVTASLLEAVNNRLKINERMELTTEQKDFIASSLGFEDVNFVETFESALKGQEK